MAVSFVLVISSVLAVLFALVVSFVLAVVLISLALFASFASLASFALFASFASFASRPCPLVLVHSVSASLACELLLIGVTSIWLAT